MALDQTIFRIPAQIPHQWQKKLVEWVDVNKDNPFLIYRFHPHRWMCDIHNIAIEERELFPRRDRHDFKLNWEWLHEKQKVGWLGEFIPWIKDVAEEYFSTVGTISFQIWEKGNPGLRAHYDFRMHKKSNHPHGSGSEKTYWRLFLPISENLSAEIEDPPFFTIEDNKEIYMTSEGSGYFMNDALCLHGVKPRNHLRGYVFIDGLLDQSRFAALSQAPLQIKKQIDLDLPTWTEFYKKNDLEPGERDFSVGIHESINSHLNKSRRSVVDARLATK